MKPFNLQEALAGKPVVMRDGTKVARIIHVLGAANEYQKILVITTSGTVSFRREDGAVYARPESCPHDLFMASEKKEGWVNVYRPVSGGPVRVANQVYETRELADEYAASGRIACARIEWSE